jgi:hypothetical protein
VESRIPTPGRKAGRGLYPRLSYMRRFSPIRRYKQSGWGREMGGEVLKNYSD